MDYSKAQDALTLKKAAKRIGWDREQLLAAVIDDDIKPVVIGRGWRGEAFPVGEQFRDSEGKHLWKPSMIVCGEGDPKADLYKWRHETIKGDTFHALEFYVYGVWYIGHSESYSLAANIKPKVNLGLLESICPALDHKTAPQHFPTDAFIVRIRASRNQETDLQITLKDLRFLKSDLDKLKEQEKPLTTKERETLLRMVYEMARDGYGWNPDDKKSPFTKELASLVAMHPDSVRPYLKKAAAIFGPGR